MSSDHEPLDGLIWSTRGRSWGFRFLLDAGLSDPFSLYERLFADLTDEPTAWRRSDGIVAFRFLDPLKRRDAASRVIPHEFVVFGGLADEIDSAEEGVQQVWPLVAEAYSRIWDAEDPPSAADLRFATREDARSGGLRSANGDDGND